MARVYILIFILFILGGIGYGAYYIYNDTMQRMAVLRENNAKLEVALDSKDAVIEELQNNMQKQIELSNELNTKLAAAEKENTKIRDKLAEGNLPEKEVVTVDRIVKPTIAIVPRPRSVEFDELKVKVITEANVQEVIEEMKTNQGQFLVYALDPMTFKNLAIGIEEIKRYIQQQNDIIIYYEKAVTDDQNTKIPVGEN